MKLVTDIDGLSTDELFDHHYATLRRLKNLVKARRGREKVLELVTDLFLSINTLSPRVAGMTFHEGRVATEEDEDDAVERVPMADLFSAAHDDEMHDLDSVFDPDELRQRIRELELTRLQYFQMFLAYFTKGCRQEIDVTKRVLAVVRRVSPHLLQQFGLSQAAVGRKLDETRAAVSAREKSKVERPLKTSGARGILSNGARGQATSAACARAAKGNQNRRARGRRGSTEA